MKNSFLTPVQNLILLQAHHYVNDFVDESISFLCQEVIKVRHTVLYGC